MPEENFRTAGHALDVETALNGSPTGQHLLLGELVVPIFTYDPTQETRGITEGALAGWVDDDDNLQISVFSRTHNQWTTIGQTTVEALDALSSRFDAQAADTDLKDVLVNAGMLVDEDATPLDLDGGTATVGDLTQEGDLLGFYGVTPTTRGLVSGSVNGATVSVLTTLLSILDTVGIINDQTTA